MRTHNELDRLAAAAPHAAPRVGAEEEDRILAGIVARPRDSRRRLGLRPTLVLVAVALMAAVVAVVATRGTAKLSAAGQHRAALSGSGIKFAGYHFKTPAGFKASDTSCTPPASDVQPVAVLNSFAAAASADGGCVEAFLLAPGSPTAPPATPADATPVAVGSYQGYYVSSDTTLYVQLVPLLTVNGPATYLVLYGQGLTEDQLIAVAQSGLPSPSAASSNRVVHNP
jgi:hypothetical protein